MRFAFGFGSGDRNPDRSGSVTGRIHQVDGGFKACHQAVVAVEAGVGESKERWCVLQDSTDIPAGQVAQTAISGLVIEQGACPRSRATGGCAFLNRCHP